MAGILDFYGYDNNTNGVISQKQQQSKIDNKQNEKIKELEENGGEPTQSLIKTTHSELKSLRDNSQLIPGCWYRITDYECTTSQENTSSAGHKFDILVLATSVNTLSEEARAIQSDRDESLTSFYSQTNDGTFARYPAGDVDYENEHYYAFKITDGDWSVYVKSLTEIPIPQNVYYEGFGETFEDSGDIIDSYIFGYFTNSNLNAWKIWYCLDNDTSRFAWALEEKIINSIITVNIGKGGDTLYIQNKEIEDGYYVYNPLVGSVGLTPEEYIEQIGTFIVASESRLYSTKSSEEFRSLDENGDLVENGGEDMYLYTFSYVFNGNVKDNTTENDGPWSCYNNTIKPSLKGLNDIVMFSDEGHIENNTFSNNCYRITLKNPYHNNFETYCGDIQISGCVESTNFDIRTSDIQASCIRNLRVLNSASGLNLDEISIGPNDLLVGTDNVGNHVSWNPADIAYRVEQQLSATTIDSGQTHIIEIDPPKQP